MADETVRVFARGAKPHGWKRELLSPTREQEQKFPQYSCSICEHILMKPVLTDCQCGARFCEECIESIGVNSSDGSSTCPKCGETYNDTYPDARVRKQLDQIMAKCINYPNCTRTGKIAELNVHIAECEYGLGNCPYGCDKTMVRSEFVSHANSCEKKVVPCPFCLRRVHEFVMADHYKNSCCKCPIKCDYCNEEFPREDMTAHVRKNHSIEHGRAKKLIQEQFSELRAESRPIVDQVSNLSAAELKVALRELREQLIITNSRHPVRGALDAALSAASDRSVLDRVADTLSDTDAEEIQKLNEDIDNFEERIAAVKVHLEKSYQMLLESDDSDQKSEETLENLKQQVVDLKKQLEKQNNHFEAVDRDVQLLEQTSKDGIFVWKISNWSSVLSKAKNKDPACIYSPCFYTSPAGYRLRLRMFPDGDRDQNTKGVSLYMMVMRGPYDPILRWPFEKQVLVTMLDQSDYPQPLQPLPGAAPPSPPERADYTCVIRPDLSKQAQLDACKMPRLDREGNASIGFVRYIDHGEMTQPAPRSISTASTDPSRPSQVTPVTPKYIRDDAVFIRVVIEPLEKPT